MTSASHPKSKIVRTYSCSVCGKKLSSSVALASHLKIHSGIKSFCCEYCGVLYSTKQNLIAHLIRIHNISVDSIKSCDVCGKQFFRKCAFDSHYLIHLGKKPFNCHICNKYFRQKITRDVHLATHSGDYKFSCSRCGKKFLSAYKCKQHMEKKRDVCSDLLSQPRAANLNTGDNGRDDVTSIMFNSNLADEALDFEITNPFNPNEGEAIKFFCAMPQCSEISFKNKTLLKKHISRTHSLTRNLNQIEVSCGPINSESPLEKISQISRKLFSNVKMVESPAIKHGKDSSSSAEFSCAECCKRFKSLQGLEYHKKAHKGFYNFMCEICGKLFIRNSHFVSHMKSHSSIRPYGCSVCWKSYKSNKNLKEHIRSKHSPG